ncbi:CHAP domain-containing protein [Pyxidicoccus parkwayensis]|uniref:CHAP domain-containing protein n=1 Tax=Pyxidicoccus parkwayensis TaxID=2813578 RepID=A0ABX7P030_9BACT|nr:CHAP domain-containing protein [Pyxidicoccus parkwaysis]QSQ22996.1 CHAP domain-containing protein [Pyxidicoccus parkwaysis]
MLLLRLRLLAAIPLCALVGCATVKSRAAEPPVAMAPEAVTAPTVEPVPAMAADSHAEDGQAGTVTVATVETPSSVPAMVREAPVEPVSVAEASQKVRLVTSGVFAAALQAASLVTGPASTTGRFWDELLSPSELGRSIVQRSIQLVGERNLGRVSRSVPNDCSGFVRLAYLAAGIDLVAHGFLAGENAVSAIFRRALDVGTVHHTAPRPGDLVFFRETYDRNRDGRRNDGMTHIGVVESVDADGTVTFIHRGGKGVARGRLNLSAPAKHQLANGGPILNDFIRPATKTTRAYLAGELFAAFASPEGL